MIIIVPVSAWLKTQIRLHSNIKPSGLKCSPSLAQHLIHHLLTRQVLKKVAAKTNVNRLAFDHS